MTYVVRLHEDGTWNWIPEARAKSITLVGVELPLQTITPATRYSAMCPPRDVLETLVSACNEALEADDVFTAEGTGARRKIRAAVAEVEKMIDAQSPKSSAPISGLGNLAKERAPTPSTPPKQSSPGPGAAAPGLGAKEEGKR